MNIFQTKRSAFPLAMILIGILLTGCGDNSETTSGQAEAVKETAAETSTEVTATITAAEEAMVTKMAAIATAIDKAPATAEAILVKYGVTAEEYEAEIYKIASSPTLSAAFEKARIQ